MYFGGGNINVAILPHLMIVQIRLPTLGLECQHLSNPH